MPNMACAPGGQFATPALHVQEHRPFRDVFIETQGHFLSANDDRRSWIHMPYCLDHGALDHAACAACVCEISACIACTVKPVVEPRADEDCTTHPRH